MDLKGLETFVWVARLGGFRNAADRLNTTQPAVSARIAQLEDELGVKLFDRDNRRSSLTGKGLEALEYAEKMLALRTEMIKAVADKSSVRGIIRLGVSETIVHTWLSRLIERLYYLYPGISPEIEVDSSINLRNRLVAHELDIAFLLGPVSEPNIKNVPLCSYPMAWAASLRLPIPHGVALGLEEMAQWPIITFARQTRPHIVIREMFSSLKGAQPRIFGNSSLSTVIRMAVDGIGICAVPPVVIEREIADGRLRLVSCAQALPPLSFTASFPVSPDSHVASVIADLAQATARGGV
jgi:DNA-binding transcriptional LysR family regulator